MSLPSSLLQAVEAALSARVQHAQPLGGGDINDAYRLALNDGRAAFVKTHPRAPEGMYEAEARGLQWLADTHTLRVPRVLAQSERFLVLEYLQSTGKAPDFDEQLGVGLAALHKAPCSQFGLDHDNFIGRLAQSNTPRTTWAEFFVKERLQPQVRMAADAGYFERDTQKRFDRFMANISEYVGPAEPPSKLHGDLWGGNLMEAEGAPCFIDPAVYGGHREMDLAMMRLFGGFSQRVFDAYRAAFPLAPGDAERVPLYQLYPLLVHVNLFGGGYVGSVQQALRRYA